MDINGVIRVNMTGAEIEEALLKARDLPTNTELTTILNEMQTAISERLDRIIETTYDERGALRDAADWVPGQLSRITDYVTTTMVDHTQSAGHPFDIVVLALSPDTLSEAAMAMVHEGDEYFANTNLSAWQLKYTLDNIEHSATDGKGTITFMHDERNCEACFDFKNIQFKRWKVSDARNRARLKNKYVGIMGTMPESLTIPDESDYVWSYLFGVDDPLNITTIKNVATMLKVSDNTVLGKDTHDCNIIGNMQDCTWGGVANSTLGLNIRKCIGGSVGSCLFNTYIELVAFGGISNSFILGVLYHVEFGNHFGDSVSKLLTSGEIRYTNFGGLGSIFVYGYVEQCDFTTGLQLCSFGGSMISSNVSGGYQKRFIDFRGDIADQTIDLTSDNVTVSTDSNGVVKIWNPADLAQ